MTFKPSPFRQYVPQGELNSFNLRQQQISQRGMYALGGWALGNIIYGAIAAPLSTGEARAFHTTNAVWGSINLVIAVPAIVASYRHDRMLNMSYGRTILQQQGTEKLYLINGALDFAYIGGGLAMWALSDRVANNNTRAGLAGAGESFMMQGGFLLLFDWSMFLAHSLHARSKLNKYTSGLAFYGTGMGYRLEF
jgi:hypothetical protein